LTPAAAADDARDDEALLRAHVAGDREAFGTLVRRHRDRLWAVALRTLADPEEAADALQDALISAFRNADSFRGDAAVTTWLHRVVVNACLDRVRRRRARPSVPLDDRDIPARQDAHAATEARLIVWDALARLPEPQRIALVLVDLEDLPVTEVAELLGVPEGTVKSRCARARITLAEWLRPEASGNRSSGSRVAPTGAPAAPGGPGAGGPTDEQRREPTRRGGDRR
jgi:RNA polymerase sigma-70 factor (ECF subfamily)